MEKVDIKSMDITELQELLHQAILGQCLPLISEVRVCLE